MTISIRNVDEKLFKKFKIEAKKRDMNIGQAVNHAMRKWLNEEKKPSILEFEPMSFGPGSERLSEEIDEILYGEYSH